MQWWVCTCWCRIASLSKSKASGVEDDVRGREDDIGGREDDVRGRDDNIRGSEDGLVTIMVEGVVGVSGTGHIASGGSGICSSIVYLFYLFIY